MVSLSVSPLDELVALGSEKPMTRAPSRLAAVSKLSLVRVEGSKKAWQSLFRQGVSGWGSPQNVAPYRSCKGSFLWSNR